MRTPDVVTGDQLMLDIFQTFADGPADPVRRAFAVVPHDSAALPSLPKALLIGGSGTIVLRAVDSPNDIAVPVTAGQILPIRASHVRASGTTATTIVALG
ncbi:spike base protein, RCAP_Rcc01079 family [Sphingomonas sp. RS2018]